MTADNESNGRQAAGSAVTRELEQLKEKVKELSLRLEREVKARQLDARLVAAGKKVREQLPRQLKALRDQGIKLGSELKSALGDAGKRKHALEEAQRKIGELKAELAYKTADLRRKSDELMKRARESVRRAATIVRGDRRPLSEPAPAEPPGALTPSEPSAGNTSIDKSGHYPPDR